MASDRRTTGIDTAGEKLETPALYQASAEIARVNKDLERRVSEQTRQLSAADQALSHEIAEHRRTQSDLEMSRARLNGVIGAAMEAIISIDAQQRIVLFNAAAEAIFGWRVSDIIGQPLDRLIPERFRAAHHEHIRAFSCTEATNHTAGTMGVILGQRADGAEFQLEASISQIEVSGATLYTIILHDMTERRQAEHEQAQLKEQLRQAQKLESIGRLTGGIAHDFNNMLTVIRGYSDLMHATMASDDPHRADLEQIRRAAEQAASLTHQLLAFSRKQILAPIILDLNDLVMNLHTMLARLVGEDIILTSHLQSALWPVTVDPGQIEQVIMNLVINARDAMPGGGVLTITTRNLERDDYSIRGHAEYSAPAWVQIAVTDTGHGMDAATQAHIFEPFFTTKAPGEGTGLGLAMAHGIVMQSGGEIMVESRQDQGSCFTINLPATPHAIPMSRALPLTPHVCRGSETILLVEDADLVRSLTRAALERAGYTVLEARDGGEAQRHAQQYKGRIDLLLSDVVMPQIGGGLVAEQVRALHPTISVLFMSGYPDVIVATHGLDAGEEAFLVKPFSPQTLTAKVRDVLDQAADHRGALKSRAVMG
ncbi:MAG: response regulator [Chloroflexales bacterium]|nr:response regulator [Chloroflexales bacterium]